MPPEIVTSPPLRGSSPAAAETSPDPVQALRLATRSLHDTLDHGLPLARPGASLADYAVHLTVLRDWQIALAPWLVRAGSDLSSQALIDMDLKDCGAAADSIPALPALSTAPVLAEDDGSDAFCWGMAYVLEGSRLGGQVLYRRLQAPLAPHPLRYLGERHTHGRPWPQTLAALRLHLATPEALGAGCRGAVVAFTMLLARFRQTGALA
ncbi:MAG: biliverdin-producing heme oxygenase [Polaromonas sp.]|nr:biliverdin-producing heme oxygenase [Polaromonas sp.]